MFLVLVPIYAAVALIAGAVVAGKAGGWYVLMAGTGLKLYYSDKYPRGEGPTSPRWNDGEGIVISQGSTDFLGGHLGMFARLLPSIRPLLGRRYLLTITEGEFLVLMMKPAVQTFAEWRGVLEAMSTEQDLENIEFLKTQRRELEETLEKQVQPMVTWLMKLHSSRWMTDERAAA